MSARDLTITTWRRDAGDSPLRVAVPGVKLTGWWPESPPCLDCLDKLSALWPPQVTIKAEVDILEDVDRRKHQIAAYVRIHRYPDAWLDVIRGSLKLFVDCGAAISWAGGWECFLHYSPNEEMAGCYAAYTHETDLICSSDLDGPLTYLDLIPGAVDRLHGAAAKATASFRQHG